MISRLQCGGSSISIIVWFPQKEQPMQLHVFRICKWSSMEVQLPTPRDFWKMNSIFWICARNPLGGWSKWCPKTTPQGKGMATQWSITSPIWLCSGEIQATESKMMCGSSTSRRGHSLGPSMSSKMDACPVLESITPLPCVNKVKPQEWWLSLVEEGKTKRTIMDLKEILVSQLSMMCGVLSSTEMVFGTGTLLLWVIVSLQLADTSISFVLLVLSWWLWVDAQTILNKQSIQLRHMIHKLPIGKG